MVYMPVDLEGGVGPETESYVDGEGFEEQVHMTPVEREMEAFAKSSLTPTRNAEGGGWQGLRSPMC